MNPTNDFQEGLKEIIDAHTGEWKAGHNHLILEQITTLLKSVISEKQLEDVIHKAIVRSLDSFGFIEGERKCFVPKYGKDAYEIEIWTSRDIANFISQDIKNACRTATLKAMGIEDE